MSSSAMRRSAAVYPRWRGEHARGSINQQITVGLSPLARGTLDEWTKIYKLSRFIPAGAGNTAK
ncbi:hypothetical protein FORC58_0949 [Salmonella enterica subsp. enterica serovar Typhimurium]|nr:hypothetical protein FORC58_0949 [Salmonella enterica subsp. enterica serovar Typhimurium]